ncbi:MAG: glycosyltransferase family 4 protein [Desulfarculus sp.]|nr:glycosyltransferase family 4 protein [Desulfarculus sp.]
MKKQSLHIAFITDGQPFHGASPEEHALGGSETACVQMARALAQRGHRVQVFCRCPRPGFHQGVVFRDRCDLVDASQEERFAVVVVSRFFTALDLPLQAGLKVLWNHDILDVPRLLEKRLDDLDLCLVLSRFHAEDFLAKLPAIAPKLALTRNGLDLDLIDRSVIGIQRDPWLMGYVSRPERGLKLLLEKVWPVLREKKPSLRLAVCGYEVDASELPEAVVREHAQIQDLIANSPGVVRLGALAKADYYRFLATCGLLLYPCEFPEISCIAALEAQALGTPLLTSDAFALRETVAESSFRVSGEPGSPEYLDRYIQRALEMIQEPHEAQTLAEAARVRVRARHDWSRIAAEWEDLFQDQLSRRVLRQASAMATSLVLKGDRAAAEELLQRGLPVPDEGPAPRDPDEEGLLDAMAQALAGVLPENGVVGVVSRDQGRTAQGLAQRLGRETREIDPAGVGQGRVDALVVRDSLERAEEPADFLRRALAWCHPHGQVLLCVAAGAWPLLMAGHLARRHDLGREELLALLPGRSVSLRYLARGLIGQGADRYFAGRWLALAPAAGPEPGLLDPGAGLRRTRPAPQKLVDEVKRAGLV